MRVLALIVAVLVGLTPAWAGSDTNLVGAWLLNETSGARADEGPYGLTLTDNNTVGEGDGRFSSVAADLERDNTEYFSRTNVNAQRLAFTATSFSVAFWIRPETANADQYYVTKGGATTSGWSVEHTNGTGFKLWIDAAQSSINGSSHTTLTNETWYHVVMIFNDTANTVTWVIDNVVRDIDTGITSNPSSNTQDFIVGARTDTNDRHDGEMDELIIFDRAITLDEISELYNSGIRAYLAARQRPAVGFSAAVQLFTIVHWWRGYQALVRDHRRAHALEVG